LNKLNTKKLFAQITVREKQAKFICTLPEDSASCQLLIAEMGVIVSVVVAGKI